MSDHQKYGGWLASDLRRSLGSNDARVAFTQPLGSQEPPEYSLVVALEADLRDPIRGAQTVVRLDGRIKDAIEQTISHEADRNDKYALAIVRSEKWVEVPIPRPELLTPGVPGAPAHVLREAIYAMMSFTEDRRAAWHGTVASVIANDTLLLESQDPGTDLAHAAEAFLQAAAYEPQRVSKAPPRAATSPRIAAAVTALLAAATIGLAFANASALWLSVLLGVCLAAGAGAATLARRSRWASARQALMGLAPMLVILLFAAAYGLIARQSATAITHDGLRAHSLGDALLLSINVALTGGVPDLTLTGHVRILVYAEILLFLGFVGANITAAGKWAVSEFTATVGQPRREGFPQN